jgi:glucokinase
MILAADIGATKTRLGLFVDGASAAAVSETYRTAAFARPAGLVEAFLESTGARPTRACLAVAAPIVGRLARSVKLPWGLDADELRRELGCASSSS